jgi:hypothetical protein
MEQMNQKINLKEIERKAYTSYHQDGIIDVTIAITVLMFAAVVISDMPWMGGIVGVLVTSIYAGMKKVITIPRIGYVKFPQQRTQRLMILTVTLGLVAMIAGVFTFMQTLSSGVPDWLMFLIDNYMITIGVAVSALFLLGAYSFKTKRIYGYSLLTLVMFLAGHFFSFPLYYYLTALGSIILITGLALMIRFVNKYPKSPETTEA